MDYKLYHRVKRTTINYIPKMRNFKVAETTIEINLLYIFLLK